MQPIPDPGIRARGNLSVAAPPHRASDGVARAMARSSSCAAYGDGDMVVLDSPEAIRTVFAAGCDEVHQPKDAQFARLLGPASLFVAEGSVHQAMRRAILPALGQAQVERHIDALLSSGPSGGVCWPSRGLR